MTKISPSVHHTQVYNSVEHFDYEKTQLLVVSNGDVSRRLRGVSADKQVGECNERSEYSSTPRPPFRCSAAAGQRGDSAVRPKYERNMPTTQYTVAQLLYSQNKKNTPPTSKLAVTMGKDT